GGGVHREDRRRRRLRVGHGGGQGAGLVVGVADAHAEHLAAGAAGRLDQDRRAGRAPAGDEQQDHESRPDGSQPRFHEWARPKTVFMMTRIVPMTTTPAMEYSRPRMPRERISTLRLRPPTAIMPPLASPA